MVDKEDTRIFLSKMWTGLAVLLIPLFVWVYWVAEEGVGLHDVVAIDHALVARSIVEGRGLSSAVVTPLHVCFENGIDKADPIFAMPALSLWQALWFQLTEPSRNTVIISSGIFYLLTAWLVFFLAARFHSTATAWVCFFVFVLNPYVLDLSSSGRPEPMGMFLVGLLFLLLSNDPPLTGTYWIPWRTCFWSGLISGILIQCVPYLALPVIVLFSYYWFRWSFRSSMEGRRETEWDEEEALPKAENGLCLQLLAVFLMGVFLPVLLVNLGRYVVPGPSPIPLGRFLIAVNSSVALGWSFWREYATMEPSALTFFSMYTPSILLKWLAGLAYGYTSIFDVFQPVICALFILALFFPEHGERFGYRWMLLLLIVAHIAVMALYYWDNQYIAVWTPLVIVTGIGTFSEFLQQRFLRHQRSRILSVRPFKEQFKETFLLYYTPFLLMLVFTTGLLFLRLWERTPPPRLQSSAAMNVMQKNPERYQVVVTPAPWMVAWHTGARTLWMPENISHMTRLEEHFGESMQTVYLPRNRAEILHDYIPSWWFQALRQQDTLPTYELTDFSGYGEAVYIRKKATDDK